MAQVSNLYRQSAWHPHKADGIIPIPSDVQLAYDAMRDSKHSETADARLSSANDRNFGRKVAEQPSRIVPVPLNAEAVIKANCAYGKGQLTLRDEMPARGEYLGHGLYRVKAGSLPAIDINDRVRAPNLGD